MLLSKYARAKKEHDTMKVAFDNLSKSVSKTLQDKWANAVENAHFEGGEALKIYGIDLKKGMYKFTHFLLSEISSIFRSFPKICQDEAL